MYNRQLLISFRSDNHKLINYIWNREQLPKQWKDSLILPISNKNNNECGNYRGISLLSASYKTLSNILLSKLDPPVDEIIGDYQFGFRVTDQLLIRALAFARYWRK
jgi:hypothetical protein